MSRHHGTLRADAVRIVRRKAQTDKLGPGQRTVFWTAWCEQRCKGCIAPETHPNAGELVAVDELACWVTEHARDGVTISGGEPLLQSVAVAGVIDAVHRQRPGLHVMLFTGYRYEWLVRSGSMEQRTLLSKVDLLVDGPYVERFHDNLLWRASRNQRLIDLTGRTDLGAHEDVSVGFEIEARADLERGEVIVDLTGVPAVPNVRDWLESLDERHMEASDADYGS